MGKRVSPKTKDYKRVVTAPIGEKVLEDILKLRIRVIGGFSENSRSKFMKRIYEVDKDVRALRFSEKETFLDVEKKVFHVLKKKKIYYRYDSLRDILYKVRDLDQISGYSFFCEMKWMLILREHDFETYKYALNRFSESPFNNYAFLYHDFYYESEYPGYRLLIHCTDVILTDIKEKLHLCFDRSKVPQNIADSIDSYFDYPYELSVFAPFYEDVEDNEQDILMESMRSLQMNIAVVEEIDSIWSVQSLQMINEQIGNVGMVYTAKIFVEYHNDGNSYSNYHDVMQYKNYYNGFWKWRETLNEYANIKKNKSRLKWWKQKRKSERLQE